MKPVILISFLLLMGAASCNQDSNQNEEVRKDLLSADLVKNPKTAAGTNSVTMEMMPVLTYKDTIHNFGTLHAGERVTYDFEFTNTGRSPLIISSATPSCGCTVADFPRKPLAPGESGVMTIGFNSADKEGHVEKTITVSANTARNMHILRIRAEVEPK